MLKSQVFYFGIFVSLIDKNVFFIYQGYKNIYSCHNNY